MAPPNGILEQENHRDIAPDALGLENSRDTTSDALDLENRQDMAPNALDITSNAPDLTAMSPRAKWVGQNKHRLP